MTAKVYYDQLIVRDHWALRRMSLGYDQVIRDAQHATREPHVAREYHKTKSPLRKGFFKLKSQLRNDFPKRISRRHAHRNLQKVTRTKLELAPFSPNFHTNGRTFEPRNIYVQQHRHELIGCQPRVYDLDH
ncbi:hypothetical protein TNCV_3821 [Trichonephila clavipes]|nr:hypothetical protein TNCV_3821 [Trichonephila clavipes]